MAFHGYPSGRSYYGPALMNINQGPFVSDEPQVTPHSTSGSLFNTAMFGATVYGLYKAGNLKYKGEPLWNRATGALRWAEEYSPGGILRTFQLSTLASQFGTGIAGKGATRLNYGHISGASLKGTQYANYLASLIGEEGGTYSRLVKEGVTLKGGKLYWGTGTQVALEHAGAFVGTKAKGAVPRIGEAYFLSMGMDPGARIRGPDGKWIHENIAKFRSELDKMPFQIIGGKTQRQHILRQLGAQGTEFVSRFNRLLDAPFEMEPIRSAFKGVERGFEKLTGKQLRLGVEAGTGTKMLGRLAKKYGLYLPLAYMGYETLDWAGRETVGFGPSDVLSKTWQGSQLAISHVAQVTGAHAYREAQEEAAPGSTTLKKLLAFPAMGALAGATTAFGIKTLKMREFQKAGIAPGAARDAAEEFVKTFGGKGKLAEWGRMLTRQEGFYAQEGRMGRLFKSIASPTDKGDLYFKGVGKLGPAKLLAGVGAAVGLALVAPFLPGALVPSTRPDELSRIYSGEQEVPIRKGRWWEFGRTPYEGTRIDYFRPNWTARMEQRAKEKVIWGEDEPSPLTKWFRKELTYDLEREHYHDRPYPITSLPFEDVPLIGPLLAHSIGKIIKPPVLMHQEEWATGGGTVDLGPGFGGRIATELGETPMGAPTTPYGAKGLIGEQMYRFTEMIGLPGFTFESAKESITGTGSFFEEQRQLESARRIAGFEREYWDLNMGGLMGTTEAFRRLFPHRRRQIELYNPIRNTMPEWLPGHGAKSPDFLHGDPYTKVAEGEMRLPGAGYAARFPELEGLAPEDYPLIHQYKILADVAPYSDKFKLAAQAVSAARKDEAWTEYEENIYQNTRKQLEARKMGKEFNEYQYLSPMGEIFGEKTYWGNEQGSSVIAAVNRMKAEGEEQPGLITSMYGGYWEWLSHGAETALDQLTPISPYAKLVHMRTAIEDYERMNLYGTQNSFWNHPIRDFLRPFSQMTMASLGAKGVPHHVEERRALEEYFDILKYVKYSRLANMARASRDTTAQATFEQQKDQTLFGINPYTRNFSNLFRSMSRRERDYFNAFSSVKTEEERQRILEMVPNNMQGIYHARWRLALADDIKQAKKQGVLTGNQLEEAEEMLSNIYDEARAEGFPNTQELWAEYVATRLPGESYGDWYRRTKLLPQMETLPGPDWVGWHPSVDLEDVKLKVVDAMGEDMHDYDLWPSRNARLQNKAYINTEAIEAVMDPPQLSSNEMRDRVQEVLFANGIRNAEVFLRDGHSYRGGSSVTMSYSQTPLLGPGLEGMFR